MEQTAEFIARGIIEALLKAHPANFITGESAKSLIPVEFLEVPEFGKEIQAELNKLAEETGARKVHFDHGTVGWCAYWLPC